MNKKVMSLLLSLILVVTSVFVSNIVAYAEESSGGLKVTATSNYFPEKSSIIAIGEEYVTVTYFINSSKDMLNTQWELNYDPNILQFDFAANMNGAGDDLNLMPSVDDLVWNVITNEATRAQTGRIKANATKLKLYKFAGKGYIPFVTATFRVIGSGETTADLLVDILTLSRLGSNFMTDPAEEEVIVDFRVINDTPTVPSRETAVHSGLYDPHCDITAPVISGIENDKTYCDAVEFEVTDNVGVASVTAGDEELTPTNGKYTLEKGIGNVTVVAKDNAGYETSVTVTVNNGHTWNNGVCSVCNYACVHKDDSPKDHECDICGKTISGHTLTKTDAKTPTCTEDGNTAYWTCSVCNKYFSDESGTNEIEKDSWVIKAAHTLTKTEAKDATCTEDGNTAYCTCSVCHKYFLDENGTNEIAENSWVIKAAHKLTKTDAKDATVTETGNKEYWQCKDCGKYFADEKGTNEIKLDDTVISKLSPEIIEGKGQSITAGEKKELTFKSNAAFSDFVRVELDGKTVDEKYYTVKEGSTIVTLKADYVGELSAGEHTIGIVSTSGTVTTTFTVNTKSADNNTKAPQTGDNSHIVSTSGTATTTFTVNAKSADNNTKAPQTGDNSHMALWIALLAVSVFGLAGTAVYSKRKRVR